MPHPHSHAAAVNKFLIHEVATLKSEHLPRDARYFLVFMPPRAWRIDLKASACRTALQHHSSLHPPRQRDLAGFGIQICLGELLFQAGVASYEV